jgi:hypothetical protein
MSFLAFLSKQLNKRLLCGYMITRNIFNLERRNYIYIIVKIHTSIVGVYTFNYPSGIGVTRGDGRRVMSPLRLPAMLPPGQPPPLA